MFIGTVAVCTVLAALLIVTATQKLSHRASVVESYRRVGVPENRLNALAALLLLGAAGLLLGVFWAPVGVAAAAALVAYFLAAVGAHIRFRDARRLPTPLAFLVLSIAALLLRILTM